MDAERRIHRLLFDAVVAGLSAPLVFWVHVPIFVLSLSKTPALLIILTFAIALLSSIPARIYGIGIFKAAAAAYLLGVLAYQVFVTYATFGLGWWRFLLFASIAVALGLAVRRWSVAAWGIFVVVPLAAMVSPSLAIATTVILLPVAYRFFRRREAVLASLFIYSFLVHLLLFGFFKLPVVEKDVQNADVLSVRSALGRVQPASLELAADGGTLAALYTPQALVMIDPGSGEIESVLKGFAGAKRIGIDPVRNIAIGASRNGDRIVVFDMKNEVVRMRFDLGLRIDYAGFFADLGFAADASRGVLVFVDPADMSVRRRIEFERTIADVCTSGGDMIAVLDTGDVFRFDSESLKPKRIAHVPGAFWFACSDLGAGRFAVSSPTWGEVVLIDGGEAYRSFYAGPGVWAVARDDGHLYVGDLFSGRVKVYSADTPVRLGSFKLCRRLRSLAAKDGTIFASTRCGLLKTACAPSASSGCVSP